MIRIGVVGTSWWTESMYLPALADHRKGQITALCGRNESKARALATRWGVPDVFTDWRSMLTDGGIDAVIVASANDTHVPITETAIRRGLHVICEKPVALDAQDADRLASLASETTLCTLVPFTYEHMPMFVATKQLIDDGFVGAVYHLSFRYFSSYGIATTYNWRFDREIAGSGVIGDLGSHALYYAHWLAGPITHVGCVHRTFAKRDPRLDGCRYTQVEDSAVMTVAFDNGAIGTLQVCSMSWEGTPFGQTHHLDLHGSNGTVYAHSDWDTVQEVRTLPLGTQGPAESLDLASRFPGVRFDTVHNTYRDVFRRTDVMARRWVDNIAAGRACSPDLAVGARVQHMIEAALHSANAGGQMVPVDGAHANT